ncbi:MAG: NF038122 family metalloprotease [Pirellulales bacterium]
MAKRRTSTTELLRNRRERLRRQQETRPWEHRSYQPEVLEDRRLMAIGPQLVGINPSGQQLLVGGQTLGTAPTDLTFKFDQNQVIDATTLSGIRLTRAGFDGVVGNGNDVFVTPGFLGIGDSPNVVVMRFAETLPDDTYRIDVLGSGSSAVKNVQGDRFNNGIDFSLQFRLNLAPQVVSVVPQPITRNPATNALSQARNQIVVYFNQDDLLDGPQSAENPAFYQLIFTQDTVSNTDDIVFNPSTVNYDPSTNRAILTFARDLDALPTDAQKAPTSRGTFRLKIGSRESLPEVPIAVAPAQDVGSSLSTALNLGELTRRNQIISSAIDPLPWDVTFPGGSDEPGHREIPTVESHLYGEADSTPGTTLLYYNFKSLYGQDPQGNPLFNLITPAQKQRAREVMEIYSHYLGIDFIESADQGLTIVTGDMRALDPEIPIGPGGVAGLAGGTTAIMDASEQWVDTYGANWFQTAMHEIGHLLGLGHTYDLPPTTVMGDDPDQLYGTTPEAIFPGLNDIIHGQYLHRPDSIDVDMYRFQVTEAGVFVAETIAERQANSSTLDSVLRLYRADGTLVAQNDDYFSEDSLLRIRLEPGIYFVGVSSTGNDEYNPLLENSGANGTSQGVYDLRLGFLPEVNSSLVDTTGVALDGDFDGQPGGVFNYWFQAQPASKTIYVDRARGPADNPTAPDTGNGTLANPYQKISTALAAATAGSLVRIVGNGGADGDLTTLGDNLAYEIGRNSFGNLRDGSTFNVPQGVSVMIDAGAILKLQNATIRVGSDPAGIDRSASSLQVLGVPGNDVYFTSAEDQTIGRDFNPLNTTPDPGEWGGLVFQNDVDRSSGRFDYEGQGEFLNHVAHATLLYGGGQVAINSVRKVFDPIHMTDARPTVLFNTIRFSADAAMSANPDSFEESRFTASDSIRSDYQSTKFTPDYSRVGPDIYGNRVVDNTTNGLFVRIDTPAGNQLERMSVSGRFDDQDIVHVISENLLIGSTPGGPLLNPVTQVVQARLDASLVVDPGIIVKLDGTRIEVELGAQLVAEGREGAPVVFTSLEDDRYGAGGTFESSTSGATLDRPAEPGDWGGIYGAPISNVSLDRTRIAYGGGVTRVEGNFAGFNAVTFYQTDIGRLTNSTLEFNGSGIGGQATGDRVGRGTNDKSVVFVRGAQPVIINNVIQNSYGPETAVISVDANSMTSGQVSDPGRSTGAVDRFGLRPANRGPLVASNVLDSNPLNGMVVRGGVLQTESVWDDTDIVHVLRDEIIVSNLHTFGGLQLLSSANQSLVVKLQGQQAGFTATGVPLEITDRIGGTIQVLGQTGHPVVITSLDDDTVGAGVDKKGQTVTDTRPGGRAVRSQPAGSFQIDLNFGPIISTRPDIMKSIEMAARAWEELLQDPITVTLDIEMANLPDGTYGQGAPVSVPVSYDTVRNRMISDATGRSTESIVNSLPTFRTLQDNVILPNEPTNPFTLSRTMNVARGNAKALGISVPSDDTAQASQFDPAEKVDGSIQFNLEPLFYDGSFRPVLFDYDPTDGILPERVDLFSTALHEMGHALGFVSSVDVVDNALADPTQARDISLSPLDLFRLKPGKGAANFESAQRVLDPRVEQVFYDGGYYDSYGIDMAGLTQGDIPLSTGAVNGDGQQASHWKDIAGRRLGLMNPTQGQSVELALTEVDRQAFDLIGYDVVGGGLPGDWRSILFETQSNDRNVDVAIETESADVAAPGTNATPETAQLLGLLAPRENAGDENRRLGFEVRGLIDEPTDIDVYSFQATAGTQVWIDVDRTTAALDTIVELIDSSGTVIVRSNDSQAEFDGTQSLFINPLATVSANPLPLNPRDTRDFFSVNTRDAGFRVNLPGQSDVVNTYHVRVRSAGANPATPIGGLSSGVYQLQIRLHQKDEKPGSTVRSADIRFAQDGIRLRGLPQNSELTGEIVEDASPNDSQSLPRARISRVFQDVDFAGPQKVGNVLSTNHGTISISGQLEAPGDVDMYLFEVRFDNTQQIPNVTPPSFADIIIDMDYADGLAGPDTAVSIFKATVPDAASQNVSRADVTIGELVYSSLQGADRDDLPAPLDGASKSDLTRGSASTGDPFLGPVRMAEGYYILAVNANSDRLGNAQAQFETDNPLNPFLRVAPSESLIRIVDTTFDVPPVIAPIVPDFLGEESVVPYHLGDMTLFVTRRGGTTGSTIMTVDAFTGPQETRVGDITLTVDDPFATTTGDPRLLDIGDLVMRDDGVLFGLTLGDTDATAGNLLKISPADATATGVGDQGTLQDDLIETYDPDDPAAPTAANRSNNGEGFGVNFEAMTILSSLDLNNREYQIFAIGNRKTDTGPAINNILYQFDGTEGATVSGNAIPNGANEIRQDVDIVQPKTAWTQIVERGVLAMPVGTPGGIITGIAMTGPSLKITDPAKWTDGTTLSLITATRRVTLEIDSNGRLSRPTAIPVEIDGTETATELAALIVDALRNENLGIAASNADTISFASNVIVSDRPAEGNTFTDQQMLAVTDKGGLYIVKDYNSATATLEYVTTSTALRGLAFSGMTAAPAGLEQGRYIGTFFATDATGNIHAFDATGALRRIFYDGTSKISTGLRGLNGLAFSTLDRNLWHITDLRANDAGHGPIAPVYSSPENDFTSTEQQIKDLVDDGIISQDLADLAQDLGAPCANTTRRDSTCFGGSSFYFGDEGVNGSADRQNFDYPGGAHGTLISQSFDLSQYSADDAPVMYFNYYLAAEEPDLFFDPNQGLVRPMRDALRVFVSDESGEEGKGVWHLVASSDEQDAEGDFALSQYGYTFDANPDDKYELDVQQLFYNTYQDVPRWRWDGQAWQNIGQNQTRDRFYFRDADNSRPWDRANFDETQWVRYPELNETAPVWRQARVDLSQFAGAKNLKLRFDFSSAASFDLGGIGGVELKAVAGSEITDGDTFVIDGQNFEFDTGYIVEVPSATGLTDTTRLSLTSGQIATDFVFRTSAAGQKLKITDTAAWGDGAILRMRIGGQLVAMEMDANNSQADPGAIRVVITGTETADQLAALIASGLTSAGHNVATVVGPTLEFDTTVAVVNRPTGSILELPVQYSPTDSATQITDKLEKAIDDAKVGTAQIYRNGRQLNFKGVSTASVSGGGTLAMIAQPGTTGRAVVINVEMTAEEVAQAMRQPLADRFTSRNVDVIKTFGNIVRIFRHTVTDPGPLGLADSLTGDDWGAFRNLTIDSQPAYRGLNNTSRLYDYNGDGILDRTEGEFELPFEGAFIDDLIIGFASRGETVTDHRISYSDTALAPVDSTSQDDEIDIYATPPQFVTGDPDESVRVGRYEVNIRRAPVLEERIDPRDRISDSLMLNVPSGAEVIDGQYFRISDGNTILTFEYDESDLNNGVTAGRIAVPFELNSSAADLAIIIRNAINQQYIQGQIEFRAALSNGDAVSNVPASDRVNIFGNAFVLSDAAPNGIDSFAVGQTENGNVPRGMGQLIIANNKISHSARYGVVVEDTERDLPSYDVFDPDDVLKHSQFTEGDFIPHPGPVRNLSEPNTTGQSQGPVIANNVIAFNNEGAIHFGGDPNGFILVAPLGVEPTLPAIEAWDGKTFRVTDIHGRSLTFEFEDLAGGNQGVAAGNIAIPYGRTPGCTTVLPQGVVDCEARYSPAFPDMADHLEEAIESSGLDITVYRTEDELFLEGATAVVGVTPGNWISTFVSPAQKGAVNFGRIVNNTLAGRGGDLTDQREVTLPGESKPRIINDFKDTGILVEDNASPTILNNVVVNFEDGIAADNSSKTSVIGGSLYQANVVNARNTTAGDFVIDLPDGAPLFIDFANGNFYPAQLSRVIDSSINSLEDRPALVTVKEPHGIGRSPVLAPARDALGQLRTDDPLVEPPDGVGLNVFKDRGAIDRADVLGPSAQLANPRDNDAEGVDKNPNDTIVEIDGTILSELTIQFTDGADPSSSSEGTGVDATTVTADKLSITQNGDLLTLGVDYLFNYDATNRLIRLTPVAGVFPNGSTYVITLADGIRDIAGNSLQDNQPDGGVKFTIQAFAGADFGDAPAPYPTTLAQNGARHSIKEGFYLGGTATAESNGKPSDDALGDFGDDGVIFPQRIERGQSMSLNVTTSQGGKLDAWIDFNRDGDWVDAGEQILVGRELNSGAQTIAVNVPASAAVGLTFARFRLSSAGGLQPTGAASDGEVEDYALTISATNGWQNQREAPKYYLDVNDDGAISATDAIRVINELNNRKVSDPVTGKLPPAPVPFPNTPGYIDTDGNGVISPTDALRIINELNKVARATRSTPPAAALNLVATPAPMSVVLQPVAAAMSTSVEGEPTAELVAATTSIDVGTLPADTSEVIDAARAQFQAAALALWNEPALETGWTQSAAPERAAVASSASSFDPALAAVALWQSDDANGEWESNQQLVATVDREVADELWADWDSDLGLDDLLDG